MMIFSRFWYAILAIVAGLAVWGLMLGVGQYNRRSVVATNEALAADSQVVKWALSIDSRHRLDAMLVASVDKGVQDSLVGCIDKDKIPQKSRDDAKKALTAINDKFPPAYKNDALFAVDRDGRLVAQVGFDKAQTFEDFEMGGYPAVYDALHGYLRDDTWVWNGQAYRVVARPVEYDVTQPPAGAVIGLKLVDKKFAQDLSDLTRTNIAFYAGGTRVASGATKDFQDSQLDQIAGELGKLDADQGYKDNGRSDIRSLGDGSLGAVYTKLDGEAYDAGAGFAVVRGRVTLPGPVAFITGADDKDKANVSMPIVIGIAVLGLVFGLAVSYLEHDMPMRRMAKESIRLKKGEIDLFQLPAFRGAYRAIANDINAGIERVAEKGGGAPRKQADLESILGPVPAQPAMSAFAFPGPAPDPGNSTDFQVPPAPPPPGQRASGPGSAPRPAPSAPGLPPPTNAQPAFPPRAQAAPPTPALQQPPTLQQPLVAPPAPLQSAGGLQQPLTSPTAVQPMPVLPQGAAPIPAPIPAAPRAADADEESTMVASIPQEIMAQASGQARAVDNEQAEWHAVYEEFVKTKKQCNEPVEGLTFDKFSQTLKKNRDALVQRHNCKRVKFTVYIKDGRASLKATPVKD